MTVEVSIDRADGVLAPEDGDFQRWVEAVLTDADSEISVRVVDEAESRELNHRYRDRDRSTNVLAFTAELPDEVELPLLGDLVICAPVVRREAEEQGKSELAHWAHMVVHGTLHLLGHDHQDPRDAAEMEALESRILAGLGYPDPYQDDPAMDPADA